MMYSICTIVLSMVIGYKFELPFSQIRLNIENLMLNDKENINNDFSIQEFIFLQKHIMETYIIKENHDKMKNKLGLVAAKVAHDLSNPINGMQMIMPKIKSIINTSPELSLLENYINRVYEISSDILEYFRATTSVNPAYISSTTLKPLYITLDEMLLNIIADNSNCWLDCSINFTKQELCWVYVTPIELYRLLVNILKNAYESLNKPKKDIVISVSINYCATNNNKFIQLIITDNGCGIPESEISNVIKGKSLKHHGDGLGLSSANEYIESINGKLNIISILNNGTKIIINIPESTPNWYTSNIHYNSDSKFVIVNDNMDIFTNLQNLLIPLDNKKIFVTTSTALKDTISNEQLNNLIFITNARFYQDDLLKSQFMNVPIVYIIANFAIDYQIQTSLLHLNHKIILISKLDEIVMLNH